MNLPIDNRREKTAPDTAGKLTGKKIPTSGQLKIPTSGQLVTEEWVCHGYVGLLLSSIVVVILRRGHLYCNLSIEPVTSQMLVRTNKANKRLVDPIAYLACAAGNIN